MYKHTYIHHTPEFKTEIEAGREKQGRECNVLRALAYNVNIVSVQTSSRAINNIFNLF